MASIAVIGAGLAGLTVAHHLGKTHEVSVFEKSRGVGGRMATRYADRFEFDHGAQFFTVNSTAFSEFVQPMIEQGAIGAWCGTFAELDRDRIVATREWHHEYPHYVGTPGMNAVGKWLSKDLDVRRQITIARLVQHDRGWTLIDDNNEQSAPFDWVVAAVPAPQAAGLLPSSSAIGAFAAAARIQGCIAMMLGFDQPPKLPWQMALVRGADISWISVNSSKPDRKAAFCLVVHSTNAWAEAHIDDDEQSLKQHLLAECRDVAGSVIDTATFCGLHRWRYANIDAQDTDDCCVDGELQLAACGDWFVRGRVEAAFQSGHALAAVLETRL